MLRNLLLVAITFGCIFAVYSPARCENLTARLYPETGEVRLMNFDSTPFEFIFYSISSESGSLNGAGEVWTSIADNYDVSGNGFIDPVNEWLQLPAESTHLAEGLLIGDSPGVLAPLRSLGLGKIWNPTAVPTPDLVVELVKPDNESIFAVLQYALDGDYDGNLVVNNSDFQSWKLFFGSASMPLSDGNHNGIVDAADYTIWRKNRGATLQGTAFASLNAAMAQGSGLSAAVAVPEPASAALLLIASAALLSIRRRGRV